MLVKFRTPLELAVLAVAEMVVRALLVYRVILAWLALQIQVAVVAVAADPYKHWKISEEDWRSRRKWKEHMAAAEDMFRKTNARIAPWDLIS